MYIGFDFFGCNYRFSYERNPKCKKEQETNKTTRERETEIGKKANKKSILLLIPTQCCLRIETSFMTYTHLRNALSDLTKHKSLENIQTFILNAIGIRFKLTHTHAREKIKFNKRKM